MNSKNTGGKLATIFSAVPMSSTGKALLVISCLFNSKDYFAKESVSKTSKDWKNEFKTGVQIKQNWTLSLFNKSLIPNFSEDSQQVCEELYNTLKEYSCLPKLRKENIYVENDLNTIHQTFMYDFLYDQQDIYDYYDEIFEKRNQIFNYPIEVRQPLLPFSFALESFDDVLSEFCDEKDMQSLANLRFYIFSSSFDNYDKNKMIDDNFIGNEDKFSIFSTTCTDTFSTKLFEEIHSKNSNTILALLNCLVLTLNFFCKMSYQYIIKYQSNDHLLLDCYIKRYKAYVESAIYMNEQLENLNALVNYLYETMYRDYPKNPKFSVYRLMNIIWHREVTTPLTDLKYERNLLNILLKTFKRFLFAEVNNIYGCDIRTNRAKQISDKDDLIMDSQFDDGDSLIDHKFSNNQVSYSQFFTNNPLNCCLGNNFSLCMPESKTSILEDVYTFGFQAKYFLEQIPSILLDTICNEYSIFYINDSQFPISQSYQVFENNLVIFFEKFLTTYFSNANKLSLIRYLRSEDFIISKLINKTRKRLIEMISQIIIKQCEEEITSVFKENYIMNNLFDEKEAKMYMKAFDSSEDKQNLLYIRFLPLANEVLKDELISEYATLYFIKEITRGKNHLYMTLVETKQWLEEELEQQTIIDKQVRKENTRRNIHLDGDIYRDQLFNFTPNFSFQHILEIYGIEGEQANFKHSSKIKEDVIMNNHTYEASETFPQTYDAQVNFNMDMQIDDDGTELKRR